LIGNGGIELGVEMDIVKIQGVGIELIKCLMGGSLVILGGGSRSVNEDVEVCVCLRTRIKSKAVDPGFGRPIVEIDTGHVPQYFVLVPAEVVGFARG